MELMLDMSSNRGPRDLEMNQGQVLLEVFSGVTSRFSDGLDDPR